MDTGKIKELISIFEQSALSTMELEADDLKIKLSKEDGNRPMPGEHRELTSPQVPLERKADHEEGDVVRSPLVGTFYAAASENAKPFVEVGQTVKQGDILCIIEAMKVMNEIHAPQSGVIREILVKDGAMVQFDEELMVIGA